MKMDELNGNFLLIVLNIVEGRGFDFLQNPLCIEANLKACKIETDPFLAEANIKIYTELVWETERKVIRKLRSCQIPVRIDCYTINADHQKEKIGFVLLTLRSARAISSKNISREEPKWFKLLGTSKKYKGFNPELALTLTIRDQLEPECAMTNPAQMETCAFKGHELAQSQLTPLMYLEGGTIQIGTQTPTHNMYIFRVIIGTAANLDLLLREDMVFKRSSDSCFFTINLLGMIVNSQKLCKNFQDKITLNDEMMFNLYTNLDSLNSYFQQLQKFSVKFFYGQDLLAYTDIHLKKYLKDESFKNGNIYVQEQVCEFFSIENDMVPEGVNGRRPLITVEMMLHENKINTAEKQPPDSDSVEKVKRKTFQINASASGDKVRTDDNVNTKCKESESEDVAVQTTAREKTPRSVLSVFKNNLENFKGHLQLNSIADELEDYHLYCLIVTIKSITWRKRLKRDEFLFKFKHPKADNTLTIHCDINSRSTNEVIILDDVLCTLHFVSTQKNICTLISLYPPLISICNTGHSLKTEEIQIYVQLLSLEDNEYTYFVILSNYSNKDDILCDLDINVKLIDLGMNLTAKQNQCDFDLDPYILDDWLMIKTLTDWQNWRKQNEEQFREKMLKLEKETIITLQKEWTKKQAELEMKLQRGIEKCAILSEELNLATNEMILRKMRFESKSLYDPETIESIEMRVTHMIEEEKKLNMEKMTQEREYLCQTISQLQLGKKKLMDNIEEKCKELEELKKNTLTKEQTTCLLQEVRGLEEKYFEVLQEKTFFKEQWRKAAKEVHMLKEEKQQQIRLDIHKKKEELSQLSLESNETQCETPGYETQNYEVLNYVNFIPGQFYSNSFQ